MGVVIALDGAGNKKRAGIEPLVKLTQPDMERVNEAILSHARSHVELIPEIANHLINSGGKRIRPMLTLAAARMAGYEGEHHLKLATAVEFMHTATLLHDDVVDESDLRRGKQAARVIWGNQASVLVGDYLLGQAFKMMVETGSLESLRILSNAACVIAEGEVLQLSVSQDMSTTEDAYMQVIAAKTAALFSAAAEVGAVVAKRPSSEQAALESYGRNLGVAFQLIDDALDYSGSTEKLGKGVGDDFRERKITLPVVLSYRRGTVEERNFWKRTLEVGDQSADDFIYARKLMERHGALKDTIDRANHYGDIARDALAIFPGSSLKDAMLEAVEFCVARAY
ncbi:polyprenyl synthetase family protein [Aestuariivirga sp.]|uniref:polyprenyl synthetase family protein n=1 Tax=Aestuariivirga sp. TaxID=2650926 RepID=UPI0025B9B62E|nr:polyprenyl synthetase family protein [Aestuariivirga sp.]MCA3554592.1 polyprenyl synthetase family protein [Aestuariivirga sp.]